MFTEWIQFALLMLAFIGFAMRNEHRMTVIEQALEAEREARRTLEKRVITLERKSS